MTLKITPEQREALDHSDGPVAIHDEQTKRVYFLVDEAIFKMMQQRDDLAAIREGAANMEAGRLVTLEELDARIRNRLGLSSKE